MPTQNYTTDLDQDLEVVSILNADEKQNVFDFMKMLDFCDMLKLPAEQIPNADEWMKAPEIIQRLVVIATERLTLSNSAYMSCLHSWAMLKEEQSAEKIDLLNSLEDHAELKASVECIHG